MRRDGLERLYKITKEFPEAIWIPNWNGTDFIWPHYIDWQHYCPITNALLHSCGPVKSEVLMLHFASGWNQNNQNLTSMLMQQQFELTWEETAEFASINSGLQGICTGNQASSKPATLKWLSDKLLETF